MNKKLEQRVMTLVLSLYFISHPHVHTIHNNQIVLIEVGDYIIPEPDGVHFYPCRPDIFEATYEPVNE